MDNNFKQEFEKQLSISKTLYQETMDIIKIKKMSMDEFYTNTELNRTILSDIKKNKSRPQLRTVISICVGLQLEPMQASDFIKSSGYNLSSTLYIDCVYADIITHYSEFGISACNDRLKELGIEEKYYLGSQIRKRI